MSEKRRYKEIDRAFKKAFHEIIKRNWDEIQQYLNDVTITGEHLIIEFMVEKEGIHSEIMGIDFLENCESSPDNRVRISIPLCDNITKTQILEYDVVKSSRCWNNKCFIDDLEEFHIEYEK